jgi:hypothetical protein
MKSNLKLFEADCGSVLNLLLQPRTPNEVCTLCVANNKNEPENINL